MNLPLRMLVTLGLVTGVAGLAAGDEVTLTLEADRLVLPAAAEQNVFVMATITGPERSVPPRAAVNLALVLDRSAAMGATFLAAAQTAAAAALDRLAPGDTVTVVAVGEQAQTLSAARHPTELGAARGALAGLRAEGRAALFGGLCQAAAELRPGLAGKSVHRLILVTPGQPGVGPDSAPEFERLGRVLRKDGIPVTCLGVGPAANADLLTRLAQASDGRAAFVPTPGELGAAVAAAVDEAMRACGRRLTLNLDGGPGVTPVRLLNGDGQRTATGFAVQLNYLTAGQPRYVLAEWRVAPGQDRTDRALARARLSYEQPTDGRRVALQQAVTVRFSAEPQQTLSSNAQVQSAVIRNDVATTLEETADLLDAGKVAEAIRSLRFNADNFRQQGASLRELGLAQQADALEKRANLLESQQQRPASKTKPAPDKQSLQQELRRDSYQQRLNADAAAEPGTQ